MPLTPYPFLMEPYFCATPWGGVRLSESLGKRPPGGGGPYGEAWELSDHPAGRSKIANGPAAGRYFGQLLREFPQGMCGCPVAPGRFPMLVKYIDARTDLSVQVHPSDATAPASDRGKVECWFVMDCEPGAEVIRGLAPGVDAARLDKAARSGEIETCLRREKIAPGDFLALPAGTVHAILGGTLLCEVQQSSNTTYRLWDWDRKPSRSLHIDESCAVANYDPDALPEIHRARSSPSGELVTLSGNQFFSVETVLWKPRDGAAVEWSNPHGLIVNVVEGGGALRVAGCAEETLTLGQTWFMPAGMTAFDWRAGDAGLRLLLSRTKELEGLE